MQALRASNARKSLLFTLVAAAHVFVIGLLIAATRTLNLPGAATTPLSALLLVSVRRRPIQWLNAPARVTRDPVRARAAGPIALSLPAVTQPITVPGVINWTRAAHEAVRAILRRRPPMAFGFPAGARARAALNSAASGVRSQGRESYRTRTGERVYRAGGNCYVVSGPPPLDASQLEREAQLSRVECSGARRGPPADNLFKNLPAYRRYHALPPNAVRRRERRSPPAR